MALGSRRRRWAAVIDNANNVPCAHEYFKDFSGGQGSWYSWGYVEDEQKMTKGGNPGTGPLAVPIVGRRPSLQLTVVGGLPPRATRPAQVPQHPSRRQLSPLTGRPPVLGQSRRFQPPRYTGGWRSEQLHRRWFSNGLDQRKGDAAIEGEARCAGGAAWAADTGESGQHRPLDAAIPLTHHAP